MVGAKKMEEVGINGSLMGHHFFWLAVMMVLACRRKTW